MMKFTWHFPTTGLALCKCIPSESFPDSCEWANLPYSTNYAATRKEDAPDTHSPKAFDVTIVRFFELREKRDSVPFIGRS